MMGSTPVTTKQLEVQRIVDVLSRAITQHRLLPGARLIEAQIVQTLGANRNHVQAALQRLAIQQLVTIEPNRGAVVAQPTAVEAREIFAARRAIERAVLESITPAMLEPHQGRIAQHMASERLAATGSDRQAIVRQLSEFHHMLGQVCGNSVLASILDNLMARSSLIVALYQRNDLPVSQCDEHQHILQALQAGNTELAVEVMLAHLVGLEGQLSLTPPSVPPLGLRKALTAMADPVKAARGAGPVAAVISGDRRRVEQHNVIVQA
jgi:DNA-binding GntR family transcriptional regulator